MIANHPTRSPKLNAVLNVVNGTKIVWVSSSRSSPDGVRLEDADDLEVDPVDADRAVERVLVLGEQHLAHARADDGDLAPLREIEVVQEAARR